MEWLKILIAVIASAVSAGGAITIWLKYYYKKIEENIKNEELEVKKEETKQIKIQEKAMTERLLIELETFKTIEYKKFKNKDLKELLDKRIKLEKKITGKN